MNRTMQGFTISIILGVLVLFVVLCGIIAWTTRKSFKSAESRISKIVAAFWYCLFTNPHWRDCRILAVKGINNNPVIAIGSGLGVLILSGCYLDKNLSQTKLEAIPAFMVLCGNNATGSPAYMCHRLDHSLVNVDLHIIPSIVMIREI